MKWWTEGKKILILVILPEIVIYRQYNAKAIADLYTNLDNLKEKPEDRHTLYSFPNQPYTTVRDTAPIKTMTVFVFNK